MNQSNNIYGVLINGTHTDVSKSIKGTKRFATLNGFDTITIRYNCGYIAKEIFYKNLLGKWTEIEKGQTRYNQK
jgi:hypothetical protein